MMRRLFLLLAFIPFWELSAQDDLSWWDQLHDYPNAAGQYRSRYQNISPGYMGPNALMVPTLFNGRIDNDYWLSISGDVHRGVGDRTENIFLELNLALAKDRVMFYVNSVPFEQYRVSPEVRDLRRMINFSGEGTATGDIQVGTVFRLFMEENVGFNMTMRAHMKTTTGSNLPNARFTNHGMYVFDAQISKTVWSTEAHKLMLKSMLGFMTWQTNKNGLPNGSRFLQNDAPLFGLGLAYQGQNWQIDTDISGYHGFIGNRDYPLFHRTQIEYRLGKMGILSALNLGLRSWDWNTFRLGVRVYIASAE